MTTIAQFEYATINDKSVEGVIGNRTRGSRMEGADKSTELWRQPKITYLVRFQLSQLFCDTFPFKVSILSFGDF